MINAVILGSLVVLEVLLICALFWYGARGNRQSSFVELSSVFFLVQLLVLTSLAAGGLVELKYSWNDKLRYTAKNWFGQIPKPAPTPGDPALISLIESQNPSLARPNLTDPNSFRDWQIQLRSQLLKVFDVSGLATRTSVKIQRVETIFVDDTIERTFLWFESFGGTWIPAYLFVPANAAQRPGILVLPGHTSKYVGGIEQTGGLMNSYQNSNALELARSGYVTLAMEFRGFGRLGASVNTDHDTVAHNAILSGSFYQAILVKDVKNAVDLLQSIDTVDENRIGIAGASLGGEIAGYYASLDPRIKVVTVHSHGGSIGNQPGKRSGDFLRGHYYCKLIPGENKHFSLQDRYLLIAPRPLQLTGHKEMNAVVDKAYELLDASYNFDYIGNPRRHEYFVDKGVEFFQRHL